MGVKPILRRTDYRKTSAKTEARLNRRKERLAGIEHNAPPVRPKWSGSDEKTGKAR